jgi:hypothetical protein
MTAERCGICEAANRDFDILIGSASLPAHQQTKVTQAYTRLGPWVTHLRERPDAGRIQGLIGRREQGNTPTCR